MNAIPYIIAEIGVNWAIHDTDTENLACAKQLISEAKNAGANAAKFQTFSAARLASANAPKATYQQHNDVRDNSQYTMLKRLELPYAWHKELRDHCAALGIDFLSSAFSAEDVDFLVNTLGMGCIKIGSGELTNARTLLAAAQSQANIVLSTGMATMKEVEVALGVIAYGYQYPATIPESSEAFSQAFSSTKAQELLKKKVTLLQCTSNYPCPLEDANIQAMVALREHFDLPVGFSDHTATHHASVAATALGAVVIEKHFTLSCDAVGPDHQASLDPEGFAHFVTEIRACNKALGSKKKAPSYGETDTARIVRQIIVAARPIAMGEYWEVTSLTTQRVGLEGIAPVYLWDLIGKPATQAYEKYTPLTLEELL